MLLAVATEERKRMTKKGRPTAATGLPRKEAASPTIDTWAKKKSTHEQTRASAHVRSQSKGRAVPARGGRAYGGAAGKLEETATTRRGRTTKAKPHPSPVG